MKSEGEEKRRKLEIRDGHRWLSRIRGRGGTVPSIAAKEKGGVLRAWGAT